MVLSCIADGWDWPARYAAIVFDEKVSPRVDSMPNLHGLLGSVPLAEAAASFVVVAVSWTAFRRTSFREAFVLCLIGGLLISRHSYVADCLILGPGLLVVVGGRGPMLLRFAAMLLQWPTLYLLLLSGGTHAQFTKVFWPCFGAARWRTPAGCWEEDAACRDPTSETLKRCRKDAGSLRRWRSRKTRLPSQKD